jgi:hypothetical protein
MNVVYNTNESYLQEEIRILMQKIICKNTKIQI